MEEHVNLLNCISRTLNTLGKTYFENVDTKRDLEGKCAEIMKREINVIYENMEVKND